MGGGPAEAAVQRLLIPSWECSKLYEQLTPTKVYHACKTHTNQPYDTVRRLCGKTAESISHVLVSCSALAQNKCPLRHNAALKVLFWEMLREFQLSDSATVNCKYNVNKPDLFSFLP